MNTNPESSLTGGFLHGHFMKTVLMIVLSLFSQHGFAAICDDFNALAGYGIIGQTDFDYENNSTINGNAITGTGNTPTPTGTSTTVNLTFPPLNPEIFPATGGVDLKPPSPPSVNSGSYGTIEFNSSAATPALIFTGGNYFIKELILNNSSTVRFAPGNYYIEKISFGNNAQLVIAPAGQVKIYLKTSLQVGNESNINTAGKAGNLIFYLYSAADFQLGNANNGNSNVNFNGIIYSPFPNTDIDFGKNNKISGAILSAGEVDVGNNTQFDYSASVQAEVIGALGCQPANHLRIEHDGSGVINQAELVRVKICANTACSSFLSFQNSALMTLSSAPSINASWSVNPVSSVNGVASSNFSATTASTYNLGISSFMIGGVVQSGYTVKCLNTTTLVLNDCNMVIKSAVHHYAITHAGTGVTCEAESVTITAHNASHTPVPPSATTKINLTTSVTNDGWSLRSGSGVFSAPNQYTFNGVETSVQLWLKKTTATTPPHIDIDVTDGVARDIDDAGTEDRALEFRDTALRFYADGNYNTIATQIAGKPSDVDTGIQALTLRAIQTNTNTGACQARLTGERTVQMAFECVSPATCKTVNGVSITDSTRGFATPIAGIPKTTVPFNNLTLFAPVVLTFNAAGTASWSMNYRDAGQIGLHASLSIGASASHPAAVLQGSSNPFVSKPAGLCVSSPDANADCATADVNCTKFKKAGEAFNLAVRAVAWEKAGETNSAFCTDNATTPNFQLGPISLSPNPVGPKTVLAGSAGINSFSIVNTDNGNVSIPGQTISEVGVFTFSATPPVYLGTTIAPSSSANIGRFYPDHFALSGASINNRIALGGGANFTYMDESLGLSYTLTAQNIANVTTQNYTTASGFARLDTPAELNYAAADITLPINLTTRLSSGIPLMSWTGGVMTIADTARITRNATADGPYLLYIGLAPVDEDLVKLASYDLDVDGIGTPLNDHALIATTQIRFGRIALGNTFGSELQALSMPLTAEFFNGSNFVMNADDSLTPLITTRFVLSSAVELGQTDGDIQVVPGATSVASFNNPLLAGNGGLSFSAPGNAGFIDVRLDLSTLPYLQFDWDGNGVIEDPLARATFGIFSGNSKQIYYRQIFQ